MRIKTAPVVLLLVSALVLAGVACTSTPTSDTGRGPAPTKVPAKRPPR